jgi:uncharacterized protein
MNHLNKLKQKNRVEKEAIIIFTRFPIPGQAKTRLIPHLGEDRAASLQRSMTEHTIAEALKAKTMRPMAVEIYYKGGNSKEIEKWLGKNCSYHEQYSGDLGVKIIDAFTRSFGKGFEKVIIIGTDCPSLSSSIMLKGLEQLNNYNIIIGPAEDGGFYLMGLSRPPEPALFHNVHWGKDTVLESVLANTDTLNLSHDCLPVLSDIDRPEDLVHLHQAGKDLIHNKK